MRSILVLATNTNIGKTYVATRLVEYFKSLKLRVGVFKPIETGVADDHGSDAMALQQASNANWSLQDISPYRFALAAAPMVAKNDQSIDFHFLQGALKSLEARCDIVIIESAGGVMTPIEDQFFNKDFAKLFDAHVLLVGGGYLGGISDFLSARYILDAEGIDHIDVLNIKPEHQDEFDTHSKSYYKDLYVMPHDFQNLCENLSRVCFNSKAN